MVQIPPPPTPFPLAIKMESGVGGNRERERERERFALDSDSLDKKGKKKEQESPRRMSLFQRAPEFHALDMHCPFLSATRLLCKAADTPMSLSTHFILSYSAVFTNTLLSFPPLTEAVCGSVKL